MNNSTILLVIFTVSLLTFVHSCPTTARGCTSLPGMLFKPQIEGLPTIHRTLGEDRSFFFWRKCHFPPAARLITIYCIYLYLMSMIFYDFLWKYRG